MFSYEQSEKMAKKIVNQYIQSNRDIRKNCAKNKTPFFSSRSEMKIEHGYLKAMIELFLEEAREDEDIPRSNKQIIDEIIDILNSQDDDTYYDDEGEDEDDEGGELIY